jgi:hypothetical protein
LRFAVHRCVGRPVRAQVSVLRHPGCGGVSRRPHPPLGHVGHAGERERGRHDAAVQPTAAIPPSQSDLATLAAAGVTHVRIPVGYWIMGPQYLLPNDTYQVRDGGGGVEMALDDTLSHMAPARADGRLAVPGACAGLDGAPRLAGGHRLAWRWVAVLTGRVGGAAATQRCPCPRHAPHPPSLPTWTAPNLLRVPLAHACLLA